MFTVTVLLVKEQFTQWAIQVYRSSMLTIIAQLDLLPYIWLIKLLLEVTLIVFWLSDLIKCLPAHLNLSLMIDPIHLRNLQKKILNYEVSQKILWLQDCLGMLD